MDGKEKKDLLIILFGTLLVLIYFLITRILVLQFQTVIPNSYEYFQLLYWGGFILVLTPLIFFYPRSSTKIKWVSVMVFVALILFSYPLLASYNHIYNRDVLYNYQVASLYLENEHLVYDGATGLAEQYIKYPGVPLLHALTSLLTGVDLEIIYLFLLPLIRLLLVPTILYLVLSQFGLSKELSILGIFIYFSSFSLKIHIHNETLAVIFLFLIIYLYLNENIKSRWLLMGLFFFLILLIHHFTFYILLLGLFLLIVLNTYKNKRALIIYSIIGLIGVGIISFIPTINNSFKFYLNIIINSIKTILDKGLFEEINLLLSYSNGINFNYLEISLLLISLGILFTFLIWSIKEVSHFCQKHRTIIITSYIITIITFPFCLTREYFIPMRIFELTLIGLLPALLISYKEIACKKSIMTAVLLILLFIGGNLLIPGGQQRVLYNDQTITHNPANGIELFYYFPTIFNDLENGYVLSDLQIFDIYGGFLNQKIYYYPLDFVKEIFKADEITTKELLQLKNYGYSYIVLHKYMLTNINDLTGEVMTQNQYQKWDEKKGINKIYNLGGIVEIYYLN